MNAARSKGYGDRSVGRRWACVLILTMAISLSVSAGVDEDLLRADELIPRDPVAALELARSIRPDTPGRAVQRAVVLARSQLFLGQTQAASDVLATVAEDLSEVGPAGRSRWLRTEATAAFALGEQDHALEMARQALAVLEDGGEPSDQVEALSVALQVTLGAFMYTDALAYAGRLQSMLSSSEIKPIIRLDGHMMLGALHSEFSDFDRARADYSAAAGIAAEQGFVLSEADARYALVQLLNNDDQLDAARQELDALEQLYNAASDPLGLSMVVLERAYLALGEEDWETADALATEAAEALQSLSVPTLAITAFPIRAKALLELGRPAEAEQVLVSMREGFPTLPDDPVSDALRARILAAQARWQDAYEAAQAQLERERDDAEKRLSVASERARARLDFETARLQRSELEAQLRVRELQIESARRQDFWQKASLLLAVSVLALAVLMLYRLRRHGKQLAELALRDELTGLSNRRAFFQRGIRMLRESRLAAQPISLMMIDLDHFKEINDEHGHGMGDRVLIDFSAMLKRIARAADVPARIGGEEFALLLPGTDREGAMNLAQRLVQALDEAKTYSEPAVRNLSASIGVASRVDDESLDDLLKRADHALYLAKRKGRARAELAD